MNYDAKEVCACGASTEQIHVSDGSRQDALTKWRNEHVCPVRRYTEEPK